MNEKTASSTPSSAPTLTAILAMVGDNFLLLDREASVCCHKPNKEIKAQGMKVARSPWELMCWAGLFK
jgi:hypothetical protein